MLICELAVVQVCFAVVEGCVLADWVGLGLEMIMRSVGVGVAGAFEGLVQVEGLLLAEMVRANGLID
jgi:hypothetical protein